MDTWLKNFKYNIVFKLVVSLSIIFGSVIFSLAAYGILRLPYEKDYYSSYSYQSTIVSTGGYLRDWIVRYNNPDIFDPEKLTQEQLNAYTGENPKEGIMKDRQNYFKEIKDTLNLSTADFDYWAIDHQTGDVISNIYVATEDKSIIRDKLLMREGYIRGNANTLTTVPWEKSSQMGYLPGNQIYDRYYKGDVIEDVGRYEIIVAPAQEERPGSYHYEQKQLLEAQNAVASIWYKNLGLGAGLIIVMGIIWLFIIGKRSRNELIPLNRMDRIPFEIQILGYGMLMSIWFIFTFTIFEELHYRKWIPDLKQTSDLDHYGILAGLIIAVGVMVMLWWLGSIIRNMRHNRFVENSLLLKGVRWLYREFIQQKNLSLFTVVGISVYLIGNMILGILIWAYPPVFGMLYVFFNLIFLMIVFKILVDYKKLYRGLEQIIKGDLSHKVEVRNTIGPVNEMAYMINHASDGLETAIAQSIKSERFKTELITNVSHDLKTPLTSIISYIDLLKGEQIENETVRGYIQVLDERSARLKQLVEDLVEASKATTGNLKTELQILDLVQLVAQEIGEYTDRLETRNLQVVSNTKEEVKVLGDGRHMWRIIDNLLSNVCKYALPGTRVYIDVENEVGYGKITIRNISSEQLAIHPSELTERFVRGDQARSTEGSGLGLAIAQSLAELQNGRLNINIDGDLFKVEILIPHSEVDIKH